MAKSFEFKKLINKKGFFCKLTYDVKIINEEVLCFSYKSENSKWYAAALFGANYFFEKFSVLRVKGIDITIYDIEDQIVDTSNMVVLYSVLMLLSEETDFSIQNLNLDENGSLNLPK